MNDFKATSLWLTILIFAAYHWGVPANMANRPAPILATTLTTSNLAQPGGPNGNAWRTYTTTHGLADNYVTAIAIDSAGRKWFGTHAGLSAFDGQSWRTYTTADGLADNHISTIAIDPAGPIWVGTTNGLSAFDGQSWRTYTTSHGLPHNSVTAIAIDPAGRFGSARMGAASASLMARAGTPTSLSMAWPMIR